MNRLNRFLLLLYLLLVALQLLGSFRDHTRWRTFAQQRRWLWAGRRHARLGPEP